MQAEMNRCLSSQPSAPLLTPERALKEALHRGRRVYGTLVTSTSPKSLQAVAGLHLDCVMIDTEHIPMNWDHLGWMCHAYRGRGIVPVVRIPRADPFEACQVLDMGAGGVVAAYVETAQEVRLLRGATKLRPLKGARLDAILAGREELDGDLAGYVQVANEDHVLLVNIESVAAIEALDEILDVPGLDGVLIGPHDLSCSLGIPEQYDHPAFGEAVLKIITKARAKNVGVGIHNLPEVEQEIRWGKAGLNLILHSSDVGLFRRALHGSLTALRRGFEEETHAATTAISI
jgi:4-hydroxy-2-oxoheptanedioate aldolase